MVATNADERRGFSRDLAKCDGGQASADLLATEARRLGRGQRSRPGAGDRGSGSAGGNKHGANFATVPINGKDTRHINFEGQASARVTSARILRLLPELLLYCTHPNY